MKPTNCSTKVLNGNVFGSKDEVDPVLVIDRKRSRSDGVGDNLLYGKPREVGPVGVSLVSIVTGDDDRARDIGSGLIGVERNSSPPLGDGRRRCGAEVGGGD